MASQVERYLLWLVCGTVSTAAIAWIAFQLQQEGFAPAILFPLLVGSALGAALIGARRLTGVPGVRVAILASLAWGLLAVVGQDYIGHRRRLRLHDEQLARQAPAAALAVTNSAEMRPQFGDYLLAQMRREPIWWPLELALTAAAAAAVVAISARRSRAESRPPGN
jgi:hypothetical protein